MLRSVLTARIHQTRPEYRSQIHICSWFDTERLNAGIESDRVSGFKKWNLDVVLRVHSCKIIVFFWQMHSIAFRVSGKRVLSQMYFKRRKSWKQNTSHTYSSDTTLYTKITHCALGFIPQLSPASCSMELSKCFVPILRYLIDTTRTKSAIWNSSHTGFFCASQLGWRTENHT